MPTFAIHKFFLVVFTLLALISFAFAKKHHKHIPDDELTGAPIIFIHGVMGSVLYEHSPVIEDENNACGRTKPTTPSLLWVSPERLLFDRECVGEIMAQHYTGEEKDGALFYEPNPNYEIILENGTESTDDLAPESWWFNEPYSKGFFDELEKTGFYRRNVNVRSFAMDWRRNPLAWERDGLFEQLDNMIQNMYKKFGKKVTIITHSNGAVFFTNFMKVMNETSDYAREYIANYLGIAMALGGSLNMLQIYLGLPPMDSPAVNVIPNYFHTIMSDLTVGIPGVNYLIPRAKTHSSIPHPLLTVKETGEVFSQDQIEEVVSRLGSLPEHVKEHWRQCERIMHSEDPASLFPGVQNIHVMYSVDVECAAGLEIERWPVDMEDLKNIDAKLKHSVGGDGTMRAVNVHQYVKAWKAAAGTKLCQAKTCNVVEHRIAQKLSHQDLIAKDPEHKLVSGWVMKHVEH